MQQGVPIVDADWNEMDDIRKDEFRTLLKSYLGEGVPPDNSFLIIAVPGDNDFWISGGNETLDGVGCCLVNGWEVIIWKGLRYTEQALCKKPGLADEWKVDKVPPLTKPANARRDMVYLDTWEREVNSQEDHDLIHPGIGLETCVRLKREWVVRVAEGATALPSAPPAHVFFPLAFLNRAANDASIDAANIADLRRTVLPRDVIGSLGSYPFQKRKMVKGSIGKSSNPNKRTDKFTLVDEDDTRNKIISVRGIFEFVETAPPTPTMPMAAVAFIRSGSHEICSFGQGTELQPAPTNPAAEVWVEIRGGVVFRREPSASPYEIGTSLKCKSQDRVLTLHLDSDDAGRLLAFFEWDKEFPAGKLYDVQYYLEVAWSER